MMALLLQLATNQSRLSAAQSPNDTNSAHHDTTSQLKPNRTNRNC